jgi:hypothetical protein
MKILYKKVIKTIDGFEGNITESEKFCYKDNDVIPKNETAYTQDDVVHHDVVTLSWNTYKKIGIITDEEILVLKKFKILK